MCGIAGILSRSSAMDNQAKVSQALRTMHHRGPDHEAVICSNDLVLGHARLAILDLTEAAHQPMSDLTGRYHLAFNGEVFNHHLLREKLIQEGVVFHTRSDTEVLLHWLILHGVGGLTKLNGFFAFAFFDSLKNELYLARDRFGEKPLWYSSRGGQLAFASELNGLRKLADPGELDPVSLQTFLTFTYIPAPHSIFSHTQKLSPGHYLHFQSGTESVMPWYHSPSNRTIIREDKPDLKQLMEEAVRMRLEADVPVGTFLSGGLDSAIVAALAARQVSSLRTYSMSFPGTPYLDESADAESVSRHIGSKHTTFPFPEIDLPRTWEAFTTSLDEPFADSSAIALFALCRSVSTKEKVVLTGDGADELFGGYRKHMAWMHAATAGDVQRMLMKAGSRVLSQIGSRRDHPLLNRIRMLKRYALGASLPPQERYLFWASFSTNTDVQRLMGNDYSEGVRSRIREVIGEFSDGSLREALQADLRLVLPNDMLVKTDLMSMRHSVELRSPFLDQHVVEYARMLEGEQLIRNGKGKWILRETFSYLLPEHTLKGRKRGFEIPLDQWIRSTWRDEALSLASSSEFRALPFLSTDGIDHTVKQALKKSDNSLNHLVYSLLILRRWLSGLQS